MSIKKIKHFKSKYKFGFINMLYKIDSIFINSLLPFCLFLQLLETYRYPIVSMLTSFDRCKKNSDWSNIISYIQRNKLCTNKSNEGMKWLDKLILVLHTCTYMYTIYMYIYCIHVYALMFSYTLLFTHTWHNSRTFLTIAADVSLCGGIISPYICCSRW